jgi:hypothetical protein
VWQALRSELHLQGLGSSPSRSINVEAARGIIGRNLHDHPR